jgi:hypothetical protein
MPVQAFEPDLGKWDAWRPDEVAKVLAGVEAPWYVAAGWAIDLFLGAITDSTRTGPTSSSRD